MAVNSDRAAEVPTRNKKTANCLGGMEWGARHWYAAARPQQALHYIGLVSGRTALD
jgi:hypothetical protein